MSLAIDPLLAPLPADRPAVERLARIPAGFVAAGTTAGIKKSGRQDFALVAVVGLSIVLTDATASPSTLRDLLRAASAKTWNQLSVDADTSTNDTVFPLASGASAAAAGDEYPLGALDAGGGHRGDGPSGARAGPRRRGCRALITCQLSSGAATMPTPGPWRVPSISSSLVKAAVHGRDANWGRIAGAAGNALVAEATSSRPPASPRRGGRPAGRPAAVDPDTLRIAIAGASRLRRRPAAARRLRQGRGPGGDDGRRGPDPPRPRLGTGTGEAFGCPLTEGYVKENSEYTT